jgi:hypothetical protein
VDAIQPLKGLRLKPGWCISEDNSEHHTRRRENLKSHLKILASDFNGGSNVNYAPNYKISNQLLLSA